MPNNKANRIETPQIRKSRQAEAHRLADSTRLLKYLAAILGGTLAFLSYPAINWTPLVAVAYVPYFWLLNRCQTIKETFWFSWLFSAVMTLGGFFWIAFTAVEFGGLPWIVAIPILLLYASVGSINLAVTAGFVHFIKKRLSMRWQVIWVTGTFVLIEAFFPKLFYWYAGNAIYQVIPLIQIADLGGPILLTTQIFWVNYAIFAAIDRWLMPRLRNVRHHHIFERKEAVTTILVGVGMVGFSLVYGRFRLQQVEKYSQAAVHKNVGVVQGNIGNFDRLMARFGHEDTFRKVFDIHQDLTLHLAKKQSKPLDLVLWPEGAYPYPFPENHPEHRKLSNLSTILRAPVVTGGYGRERKPVYQIFNTMVLMAPGGTTAESIYKKHILLAFGEYMPFSKFIPALKDLIPAISDFGAGPGAVMMKHGDFKIASLICYEALDSHYMRAYSKQSPNLILNVTNDSWFGPWQEPEQHLALSQLRCVESRIVQVRSTNTGISAIIWPSGKITNRTEVYAPEVFAAEVPLMQMPMTVYSQFGDWWAWLLAAVVIVMALLRKRGM